MAAGDTGTANVVLRVSTQGADQVGSSFDTIALDMTSAARHAASGVGGLLASTENLYNAQQRLNVAQISYTLAVREYGAGSIQAARAHDQLTIATNGLTVAQDRLNVKYIQFALTTGPQVYTAIMKAMAASAGMTMQNYAEAASWYAKAAAAAVAIGIITLGIGIATGLASGAAVNQTISQQNNFYNAGTTGTSAQVSSIGASVRR
jgi:hypothetical protein